MVDLTYSLIYIKLSLNNQNLTQFLSASISVMIIINIYRLYSYKMFYTSITKSKGKLFSGTSTNGEKEDSSKEKCTWYYN